MFSEQIAPLVCLRNEVWTMRNRKHVLTGRGLARRPPSAWRVHIKITSHVAQCIHNKSYCADRDVCRFYKIWTKGYREHSQCSQSERSCTENLFREHFVGVVNREHIKQALTVNRYIAEMKCLGKCYPVLLALCLTLTLPHHKCNFGDLLRYQYQNLQLILLLSWRLTILKVNLYIKAQR